jgi:hypothetical protein
MVNKSIYMSILNKFNRDTGFSSLGLQLFFEQGAHQNIFYR